MVHVGLYVRAFTNARPQADIGGTCPEIAVRNSTADSGRSPHSLRFFLSVSSNSCWLGVVVWSSLPKYEGAGPDHNDGCLNTRTHLSWNTRECCDDGDADGNLATSEGTGNLTKTCL